MGYESRIIMTDGQLRHTLSPGCLGGVRRAYEIGKGFSTVDNPATSLFVWDMLDSPDMIDMAIKQFNLFQRGTFCPDHMHDQYLSYLQEGRVLMDMELPATWAHKALAPVRTLREGSPETRDMVKQAIDNHLKNRDDGKLARGMVMLHSMAGYDSWEDCWYLYSGPDQCPFTGATLVQGDHRLLDRMSIYLPGWLIAHNPGSRLKDDYYYGEPVTCHGSRTPSVDWPGMNDTVRRLSDSLEDDEGYDYDDDPSAEAAAATSDDIEQAALWLEEVRWRVADNLITRYNLRNKRNAA